MSNEKKNLISLSELDQLTHRCLTIMSLMDRLAGCVQNGAPEDDAPGKTTICNTQPGWLGN